MCITYLIVNIRSVLKLENMIKKVHMMTVHDTPYGNMEIAGYVIIRAYTIYIHMFLYCKFPN